MKPKYTQMLRGMKNGGDREWTVYILRCGDGSLYTGIAKDIALRLKQHSAGRGAAYTKTHLPVELVHHESPFTRSEALIREAAIKHLPRPRKEALFAPVPPAPPKKSRRRPTSKKPSDN